MKKLLAVLIASALLASLSACGMKDAIQSRTKDFLDVVAGGIEEIVEKSSETDTGNSAEKTGGGQQSPLPAGEKYDAEITIVVGATGNWTPFPSGGSSFETGEKTILSLEGDGKTISFKGLAAGDAVITAISGGETRKALIKVRAGGSASNLWRLTFSETSVLDVMGLASVSYTLDLTAYHEGPDMLGAYTGEIAMSYDANLDAMAALLSLSGGSVDYETNGWFRNDAFKMDLMAYDKNSADAFADSIMSEGSGVDAETQALIDAYLGDIFSGIGGGTKSFETSSSPKGLWYDWAFHMTDGDMSAYFNMTGICMGMVSGSAVQDTQGDTASGYVDVAGLALGGHVIVSPTHETFNYKEETPFPYTIEVYESGDAVFTLRAPDSPITVKFYGKIEKI